MQNSVRKVMVLLATTGAALAMSIGPASADTNGLSDATKQAWENWDEGGCLLVGGAAKMVSGAWVGAPSSILDLGSGGQLSEATKQAWANWDEGGAMAGNGAAKMVSGAWIGVPNSILDLANQAGAAGMATGDLPDLPALPLTSAAQCAAAH